MIKQIIEAGNSRVLWQYRVAFAAIGIHVDRLPWASCPSHVFEKIIDIAKRRNPWQ